MSTAGQHADQESHSVGSPRRPNHVEPRVSSPKKPSREILADAIAAGIHVLQRPRLGLGLSSFAAGLEVGLGIFMMVALLTESGLWPLGLSHRLVLAVLYATGFVLVIVGRSELFTEHTALVVLPVFNGDVPVSRMLQTWALVYSGNLAGAVVFSALAVVVGQSLGITSLDAFGYLGGELVGHSFWVIFGSAVIAGWLMGLLSWLVSAARDTVSMIILVTMVTGLIAIGGFHHCIAGTVEVLVAVFAGQEPALSYLHFIVPATLGNAVGGVVFVAVTKYGHSAREER